MAAENVSDNNNLSELYENLIVIGELILSEGNIPIITHSFIAPQIAELILPTKSSFVTWIWCWNDPKMRVRRTFFLLRPCYRFLVFLSKYIK